VSFPFLARFTRPDNGWPQDRVSAAAHLTVGGVYTVTRIETGSSKTLLYFAETSQRTGFNSVMFDPATEPADTATQWCVAYGGDDPNECAGTLVFDGEAEAREQAQWIRDGMLARRTVITSDWKRVP